MPKSAPFYTAVTIRRALLCAVSIKVLSKDVRYCYHADTLPTRPLATLYNRMGIKVNEYDYIFFSVCSVYFVVAPILTQYYRFNIIETFAYPLTRLAPIPAESICALEINMFSKHGQAAT